MAKILANVSCDTSQGVGPLTNKIDFDIYVYNKNLANINNLTTWNVYGLNYDDV